MTEAERFFSKVVMAANGCWQWTGGVTRLYGRFFIGVGSNGARKYARVHRWSYEHHRGPVPAGLVLDHLCRNRLCVNPDHLEPVTNSENVRRQNAAKTHCPHGHEYTPENTRRDKKNKRTCRACGLEYDRRRRARVRAALSAGGTNEAAERPFDAAECTHACTGWCGVNRCADPSAGPAGGTNTTEENR